MLRPRARLSTLVARTTITALALAAAGCGEETLGKVDQAVVVCAGSDTLQGMDVSSYQGVVNWDTVAASGITFAFIRVSDGTAFPDSKFDTNWPEARRVGVLRGAYQYFRAGTDPVAQADLLISHMGTLEADDLSPVLDLETDDGQTVDAIVAAVHVWMDRVQQATGRTPIIYTGKYSWPRLTGPSNDFVNNPLWVAQWGVTCPDIPAPWTAWAFWQTSATGTVSGISGDVDLDEFNGTRAALLGVAGGTPTCGDGFCVSGETNATCPGDCPVCANVPAAGRIVDESEVCFVGGGNPTYLRHETAGWDNTLIWTHTTANASPSNYGLWNLTFDEAGRYSIEAYTVAPWSQSRLAVYRVLHEGTEDHAPVDQTAVDGWNRVGEFQFAAGGSQWVRVDDNTGEAGSLNVQLVFDALRITRVSDADAGAADAGQGDAGGTDAGASDAGGADGSARADAAADASGDAASDAADGRAAGDGCGNDARTDAGLDGGTGGSSGGCACDARRSARGRGGEATLLAAAAALAFTARRARRRAS